MCKSVDAGRQGDGTLVCCGCRVEGMWMKWCSAAGPEERDMHKGRSDQFQQQRGAGGGPICRAALCGESMQDASKLLTDCWA